jgi:hypothetical protein
MNANNKLITKIILLIPLNIPIKKVRTPSIIYNFAGAQISENFIIL